MQGLTGPACSDMVQTLYLTGRECVRRFMFSLGLATRNGVELTSSVDVAEEGVIRVAFVTSDVEQPFALQEVKSAI